MKSRVRRAITDEVMEAYIDGDDAAELAAACGVKIASITQAICNRGRGGERKVREYDRCAADADRLAQVIYDETGLDVKAVTRKRLVVRFRHAVMAALRERGYSLPVIAQSLQLMDHKSVLYGLDQVKGSATLKSLRDEFVAVLDGRNSWQAGIGLARLLDEFRPSSSPRRTADEVRESKIRREMRNVAMRSERVSGMTLAEIGQKHNLSTAYVQKIVGPSGLSNRIPAETEARIIRLAKDGWHIRAIERESGVSQGTVTRVLRDACITAVSAANVRFPAAAVQRAVKLFETGVLARDAAERCGVSKNAVLGAAWRKKKRDDRRTK